jgi:integrase
MTSALQCNSSRVLTVDEANRIRAVIEKPSSRVFYDLMLHTGLRLSEVVQLRDNPAVFDQERRSIVIKSGKTQASQSGRNVCLSDRGMQAVREYLALPSVPSSPSVWQRNLIRWAQRARLVALPGQEQSNNPTGITVRTSRKTLESWLLAAHPDKFPFIVLSQGHNELVSIRHYLNISWTKEEREAIKEQVRGWGCQ